MGNNGRLSLSCFDLPVHEIRRGYRSDVYFWRSKVVLEKIGNRRTGLIQVFQKRDARLCGIDEALGILRLGIGRYRDLDTAYRAFDRYIELKIAMRRTFLCDPERHEALRRERSGVQEELDSLWEPHYADCRVEALHDGDPITPRETVLHMEGRIADYVHLETLYLGVLARRTRVATNVARIVEAAETKPVLYFPARFDHWAVQGGDGYAARVGGAAGVSTDAQASWWGNRGMGTVPHALIAAFEGDAARRLGSDLWGVRLDTAEDMVDLSLQEGAVDPDDVRDPSRCGVNEALVLEVRDALDREGFGHVKVVVSGGFDEEKVRDFEEKRVPVDAYGVGSSLLEGNFNFTADVTTRRFGRGATTGSARRWTTSSASRTRPWTISTSNHRIRFRENRIRSRSSTGLPGKRTSSGRDAPLWPARIRTV